MAAPDESDDRTLDLSGRVILPRRMGLSFDRDTGLYVQKDRLADEAQKVRDLVAGIPEVGAGPGLTRDDLAGLWQKDPRKEIRKLTEGGYLTSTFEPIPGTRTREFRYWRVPGRVTDAPRLN
jgi:hypothetical protein